MINLSALKRKAAPKAAMIGVRIDEDTKAWLERVCDRAGISVSALVAELIQEFRKGHKDE